MTRVVKKPKRTRGFLPANAAAIVRAIESPTKVGPSHASTWAPVAHYIQSDKGAEIDRQIERIKPYLLWLKEEDGCGIDEDGLNRSIAFLRAFANSPAPVPMLAIGNDGKPSAYLKFGDVALEAMFEDDTIQYLFTNSAKGDNQYFDEILRASEIPPRLMVLLYQYFARNSGTKRNSSSDDV